MEQFSDNEFDKLIRSEMNEYSIDLNTDDQWNRLCNDLDNISATSSYSATPSYWKSFNIVYQVSIPFVSLISMLYLYNVLKGTPSKENDTKFNNSPTLIETTDSTDQKHSDTIQYAPKTKKGITSEKKTSLMNLSVSKNGGNGYGQGTKENDQHLDIEQPASTDKKENVDTSLTQKSPIEISESANNQQIDKKPLKPKKIKYITKRDTLLVVDTMHVKKKR